MKTFDYKDQWDGTMRVRLVRGAYADGSLATRGQVPAVLRTHEGQAPLGVGSMHRRYRFCVNRSPGACHLVIILC